MIGIVNYGCGNVGSIQNMFSKINVWSKIITNPEEVKDASAIILPGVGSYDYAIDRLMETNFWSAIKHHVEIEKKPILGICLGMQLLFESSDEGVKNGFGFIQGKVEKFKQKDEGILKIPHIGWEQVAFSNKLFDLELKAGSKFYFVHSFHAPVDLENNFILGKSYYEYSFPSAIIKENIIGFQFHPEKSLSNGMELLKKWWLYVKENE